MSSSAFPRSIDQLDNAWLSSVFAARVAGFKSEFIEGGVLSDAYIVHDIRYASGVTGPVSAVAKFANAVDDRRAFAVTNNSYLKELNFYRDLADQVPLRAPKIYALSADNDDRPEFFVILMEDLTAHSRVFDQVEDPPTEPFMRKIALELATMHAQSWESDVLRADWQLIGAGPPGPEFTQAWQHSAAPELRRKDRDVLRQYHDRLVELNPTAAAYTYEMLFDDYRLGYLLWWAALLTLGVATLPIFDKPEGARMKRLWGQGLTWMNIAMTDHDCLGLVESIIEGRQ